MKETGRQVIVAKTAGFCFGVERAVNEVYEQLRQIGRASCRERV